MITESQKNKMLQDALRILSKRSMSTQELKQRLLARYNQDAYCDEIVDYTIHRLHELNVLSDDRVATSIARRHAHKGDRFIRQKLKDVEVDDVCIVNIIAELEDELIRAREVAIKKLPAIKADTNQQKELKLIRFLSSRGFKASTCYQVAKQLVTSEGT